MVSNMDSDAVDVVRQGLAGGYESDERMHSAAAVLADRLERVRRLGGLFDGISFSPQMDALMSRQMAGAV